jgi:hypothetical protein
MVRVAHSPKMRAEALRIAELRGVRAASDETGAAERTIRYWLRQSGVTASNADQRREAPVRGAFDPTRAHRWRGEHFRLVRDHSLLRYFIVRRGDALPPYCTLEHKFSDGRLAIHDRELVVSARALRLHPKYTKRIAAMPGLNLYDQWSRKLLIESGLIRHSDDAELVGLLLAMVTRDRSRDNLGAGNE